MKAVLKYIVFRDTRGTETVETFNTSIIHAAYVRSQGIRPAAIVSAGFVSEKGECFGVSTSLQKASRPRRDTVLLRNETEE